MISESQQSIRAVVDRESGNIPDKKGYYILELDYSRHMLRKIFFSPSQFEEASLMYDDLESNKGEKPLDIVLVRAASFSAVREAYPNYFLDMGEFVDLVSDYLR